MRFCWCRLVLLALSAVPSLEAQEPTPGRALLETLSQLSWRAVELSHQRSQNPGLRREPIYQGMGLRGREAGIPRSSTSCRLLPRPATAKLLPPILGASREVLEPRECRLPAGPAERLARERRGSGLRLAYPGRRDGLLLFLEGSWTPQYTRTVLHAERPLGLGRLRVRPFARVAWGENLPFCLGFWPGGFDRFPGLKAGEARGDREVTGAVDLKHPIAGKLSARALVAAGRTSEGGPVLPPGPWLLGVRAGLNLDSRLGELRAEYGVATGNHRALFIGVGRLL